MTLLALLVALVVFVVCHWPAGLNLVLSLIIAVIVGVVLTALAGYHRGGPGYTGRRW